MVKKSTIFIARKQELPLDSDNSSPFLKVMISIAVFLFAVTLAGVMSINAMLVNWNESILGSLTVQIMPVNDIDKEKAAAQTLAHQEKAIEVLKKIEAVERVAPLEDKQLQALIRPWLGDGVKLENLPIPRLIDVKIKRGAEIDFVDMAEKLAEATPYASLDNHKLWLSKLISFADGLKMLALAALVLVILVTSGAIFYTTQTSLGLHCYIIEILHQMGAKDAYIAQQYAKRTAWLGLVGGVIGVLLAIPTIFLISGLASQIEGGIISEARLTFSSWLVILSLPLFSALISMLTAYYTVKNTLQKMM